MFIYFLPHYTISSKDTYHLPDHSSLRCYYFYLSPPAFGNCSHAYAMHLHCAPLHFTHPCILLPVINNLHITLSTCSCFYLSLPSFRNYPNTNTMHLYFVSLHYTDVYIFPTLITPILLSLIPCTYLLTAATPTPCIFISFLFVALTL